MTRFRLLVGLLIVVFAGALVYIEVVVENNQVIAENSTVEMWSSYTDKNGDPVTSTDSSGKEVQSTTPTIVTMKYSNMPEELQEKLLGKKIGEEATYTQDTSQLAESSIDEATMPYEYTVVVNKVKVDHDYVAPVEEEEENSDSDSSDDSSSDDTSTDESSSETDQE